MQVRLPGSQTCLPRQAGSTLWVLAPVVCAVPSALRDIALSLHVEGAGRPLVSETAAVTTALTAARSGELVVTAATPAPAGLLLSPLCLLPGLELCELVSMWGPEALPWQRMLHSVSHAHELPHGTLHGVVHGAPAPASQQQPQAAGQEQMQQGGPKRPEQDVMYELYLCPSEQVRNDSFIHAILCCPKLWGKLSEIIPKKLLSNSEG